jgi:hypothetical protein
MAGHSRRKHGVASYVPAIHVFYSQGEDVDAWRPARCRLRKLTLDTGRGLERDKRRAA